MIKHVGKHNTAIKIAVVGCLLASLAVIAFSDRSIWDWLPLAFSICSAALLYVHYIRFEQETSSESERTQRLSDVYRKTAEALASAIAAKDGYEQHHVRRVEMICEMMAKQLRLREDDIDGIRVAALLHDVGKLGVPEYILLKPGPLDPDEFSKMRNHAVIGAQVLNEVNYPWDVAGMVRHHHENYDGTGYPNQLAGEKIPLGSRIIAVAEVYDALVCARCYKEGWSHLEAVEHIQKLSGTRFDPKVVSAFIEVAPEVARIKEPHKPAYGKNEGAIVTGESFAAADMIARANQELISLFEITQTLSSTLELDEVLSLLTHRTRRLSQSATCAVFLVDELHPQSMVARIASGRWQEMIQGATVRVGRGVTGKAAAKMTSYIGNYDPNDLALGMDAHAQVNFSS
ncbi:HD domain-containing protein [bacterium]|nr:HD domain-containing protein [bacterium]